MNKYSYKLTTISRVILSPRAHMAFVANSKIIYPFYQYGSYEVYRAADVQYYIPGSSIKGALLKHGTEMLFADDIRIPEADIEARHLYKVQKEVYGELTSERNALMVEVFFPNVKVEMLGNNLSYQGMLTCDTDLKKILTRAREKQQLIYTIMYHG